jgi:DNA-binding transcriptional regulator YiaG
VANGDHLAKRGDAGEWEDLAKEYEQQARTCAAQTKEALAKYEAAEAEIKELRKRLQLSADVLEQLLHMIRRLPHTDESSAAGHAG